MKNHGWHFAACAVFLALGVILVAAGVSVLAVLPAIGCLLMMVLMMWGKSSMHGGHG
jgi:hypothetical protein